MSIYPLKHEVIFDQEKELVKNISENIWLAWQFKKGASYIIKIENGAVLIDSTGDKHARIVLEALKQINLKPENVKIIFNTHYHFEQIAGNHAFTEAKIYAYKDEIPFITGEKKGNQKIKLSNFFSPLHTKKSINDLVDNTKLTYMDFCLHILHTPGHTTGSLSYLYKNTLFVGDLLMFKEGKLYLSQDTGANTIHKSVKKLLTLDFEYLCLGNGHVFSNGKNILTSFSK